jgi:hemerythrin-like domain-containing protein
MSKAIDVWRAEHANFTTLLDLLERELDVFHEGESPDYELMSDIMFYMTHYADLVHHAREDLAFAKIKQRDTAIQPVLDELAEQHRQLKAAGEALLRALDNVIDGAISSRDHVEAPGRAYIAAFRGHMAKEETTMVPLAGKILRAGDWAAIDSAVKQVEDPLFGNDGGGRFAALRRQIALEARLSRTTTR